MLTVCAVHRTVSVVNDCVVVIVSCWECVVVW